MTPHRHPSPLVSRREAGAVLLLAAIALLLLLGFGALAVDGSHIYMMNTECQATADGAALAGGYLLPNLAAAEAEALEYAAKNMPPGQYGQAVQSDDVEFGTWNFSTRIFTPTTVAKKVNAVRVTTHLSQDHDNPLQLTLANALGFPTMDVTRRAVAAFGSLSTWDVSLAQDVTDSFVGELHSAKDADQSLLDCFSTGVDPDSTFGVVTFTGWGHTVSPMLPIGSAYNSLKSAVDAISPCGSAGAPPCSGTDLGAGLDFALQNLLDASGMTPGASQAIVLVTDGNPHPHVNGSHFPATVDELKLLATQAADAAWSQGVSIYVVFYDENNDVLAAQFLPTLVRGNGVFLSTPDPEQLPDLLTGICGSLGPLRLVE